MSSPFQQRISELERQLAAERQKHGDARQLLHQTELAVRSLEIRLQGKAHAQQEELEGERRATIEAQRALDNAFFELQHRSGSNRSTKAGIQEQGIEPAGGRATAPTARAKLDAVGSAKAETDAVPPEKRGRPRTRPEQEPKPVCWWTPSYRSKVKG